MKENVIHRIYFLGIGGIGMSALARYFNAKGYEVYGYDRTQSPLTERLEGEGMKIHYEDRPDLIPETLDFAVFTPAIPKDLGERIFLEKRVADNSLKMMKRAEVLGMLSRRCKTIAVAGSHGKTTTTALISHIFMTAGKSISAFIGGISNNIDSNVVIGDGNEDFMVMEADEFDRSFLQLSPYIGIVTSMDADHLDIYGDKEHLAEAFNEFVNKISEDGTVIFHENLSLKIKNKIERHSYGTNNAYIMAKNVNIVDGMTDFEVVKSDGSIVGTFKTRLYGMHNVNNAVAAIAASLKCGLGVEAIAEGLATFKGVKRRFDMRADNGKVCYIDDYAHHPEEIKSTLTTARELFPERKMVVAFQPHLFTRTRDFMDDFAESLSLADSLVLLDIYPAREKPIDGITSEALLEKTNCKEKQACHKADLVNIIENEINKDDIKYLLITMGAGDIDRFVPIFEKMFSK